MYSKELIDVLEDALSAQVTKVHPVGGGCINRSARITTTAGDFFVKANVGDKYPGMFEAECEGLLLLARQHVINVPRVINIGKAGNEIYIVLEFIEAGAKSKHFWVNFGRNLAQLHRSTASQFGLNRRDNYIGSLPQLNEQADDWPCFFEKQRLRPQWQLALNKGILTDKHLAQFEKVAIKLINYFPAEPPALLHGDLWSGNFLTGPDGAAWLIDPAVYYGHREAEIAFTGLFGGFDQRFYDAYNEAFPLQPGFEERKDLYNLYPLLVHLNLFGKSYLPHLEEILKRYS